MRFECFNYRVSSCVKFTGADLVALQDAALGHYDHKSRSLGGEGGWITDQMQILAWNVASQVEAGRDVRAFCEANPEAEVEVELTWRDFDKLSKVLEQCSSEGLRWELRRAFKAVQAETRRLGKPDVEETVHA